MLGETENQSSLTRAAQNTCGRAEKQFAVRRVMSLGFMLITRRAIS